MSIEPIKIDILSEGNEGLCIYVSIEHSKAVWEMVWLL